MVLLHVTSQQTGPQGRCHRSLTTPTLVSTLFKEESPLIWCLDIAATAKCYTGF